jgi:hypothetical protein
MRSRAGRNYGLGTLLIGWRRPIFRPIKSLRSSEFYDSPGSEEASWARTLDRQSGSPLAR